MSTYARNTYVSVDRSRSEIESILARYGASAFAYATSNSKAMIQFQANERRILFILQLPDRKSKEFTHTKAYGHAFSPEVSLKKWEQACRQKWRCLALAIKAKLESVESGISSFEDEFMSHIVMPDGKTVGDHLRPKIEQAHKNGKMPSLLPHLVES